MIWPTRHAAGIDFYFVPLSARLHHDGIAQILSMLPE